MKFWRPSLLERDEGLFRQARELVRPGDSVWDCGASVGLFTFAAAWCAGPSGKVLAVEPDPWVVSMLARTRDGLPELYAKVEVLEAAVSDQEGMARLGVASRGRASSHLVTVAGSTQAGATRSELEVRAVTFDSLLEAWAAPDVVKIDVETAEALVIKGGPKLFSEVRPIVLCEVASQNRAEVMSWLTRWNYVVVDARMSPNERKPLAEPVWDSISLPSEARGRPLVERAEGS